MLRRMTPGLLLVAVAVALSTQAAAAASGFFDQVRLGVYQHDTGIIGNHKEAGVDLDFEALSRPVTALSLILSPRIVMGGTLNSAGKTDQIYLGLSKQWNFVRDVFSPDDAFFVSGTVGGAWHNGKLDVHGTPAALSWKSHGSHLVFRTGMEFGYQINSAWSVAVSFNHISNAGLAQPNEGMNNLGLRLGIML